MNKTDPFSKLKYETVRQSIISYPYAKDELARDLLAAAKEAVKQSEKLAAACRFFNSIIINKVNELKTATELVVIVMEKSTAEKNKKSPKEPPTNDAPRGQMIAKAHTVPGVGANWVRPNGKRNQGK